VADCIFCKIASGAVNSDRVYEDDSVLGFRDINPQAPTHVVIIPKRHIPTMNDVSESDPSIFSAIMLAGKKIAESEGISDSGYRIVMNCNREGGQEIFHMHAHLFGGRYMGWPPG
jgi:histidine triad (HIT) family protein